MVVMGKISEADWKYRGNYLCEQAIWQVMLSYAKKTEAIRAQWGQKL